MKQFDGFPSKMEFTSIPNIFLSKLVPEFSDIAELKATLHMLAAIYRKRGYPRFVTYKELLADAALMNGFAGAEKPAEEILRGALKMAVERGTFLRLTLEGDGADEDVYFLNSEADRKAVARIENGELRLSGLKTKGQAYVVAEKQPDIFTLYEQNIGVLTPMIADELREAEKLYPEDWIRDAVKEAVNQNKRKWSYISAILERWSSEGRSDGTYQRDSKKGPDKYVRQRYGHMVQR